MKQEDVVMLEKALLGALILDNAEIDTATQHLQESDFIAKRHRIIFSTIIRMSYDSTPVTIITLTDELSRNNELTNAGGSQTIAALTTAVDYVIPASDLVHRVLDHARRRRLIEGMKGILEVSAETASDELIGRLESLIAHEDRSSTDYTTVRDMLKPVIDEIETMHNLGGQLAGLSTGIPEIDNVTFGMQDGNLIVIGARASIGKTALALTIAENIGRHDPVGFQSLEMSAKQLTKRSLAMESRTEVSALTAGRVTEQDMRNILDAARLLYDRKIYILDRPRASLPEVLSTARRMYRKERIRILFLDYIGLLTVPGFTVRHEAISYASKMLKQLARDLNIPVVVLAQIGRQSEGKRPMLSDLRDTGALEEDSDVVMLLHRDRESDDNSAELNIAKNRNGPTRSVQVAFAKEYTLFASLAKANAYEGVPATSERFF